MKIATETLVKEGFPLRDCILYHKSNYHMVEWDFVDEMKWKDKENPLYLHPFTDILHYVFKTTSATLTYSAPDGYFEYKHGCIVKAKYFNSETSYKYDSEKRVVFKETIRNNEKSVTRVNYKPDGSYLTIEVKPDDTKFIESYDEYGFCTSRTFYKNDLVQMQTINIYVNDKQGLLLSSITKDKDENVIEFTKNTYIVARNYPSNYLLLSTVIETGHYTDRTYNDQGKLTKIVKYIPDDNRTDITYCKYNGTLGSYEMIKDGETIESLEVIDSKPGSPKTEILTQKGKWVSTTYKSKTDSGSEMKYCTSTKTLKTIDNYSFKQEEFYHIENGEEILKRKCSIEYTTSGHEISNVELEKDDRPFPHIELTYDEDVFNSIEIEEKEYDEVLDFDPRRLDDD